MERDRLHRDLVTKLEQLNASRLRIVRAGDAERRRLERNLHDGAQQRLTTTLLPLRSLATKVFARPGVASACRRRARGSFRAPIEDLRELARGLHPPLLAREGLEAALRAGATRSTVPVELDVRIDRRIPPALEAAAYYVCAEAATNTVKHAQASQIWLSAVQENGTLTIVVRDDGIGGACVECGTEEATGLGGLKDRVEALGGVLDVDSPKAPERCSSRRFRCLPRSTRSVNEPRVPFRDGPGHGVVRPAPRAARSRSRARPSPSSPSLPRPRSPRSRNRSRRSSRRRRSGSGSG